MAPPARLVLLGLQYAVMTAIYLVLVAWVALAIGTTLTAVIVLTLLFHAGTRQRGETA